MNVKCTHNEFPSYFVEIDVLGVSGRQVKAIKPGFMVLRELSEKLDFSPNGITGGRRVDVCQED